MIGTGVYVDDIKTAFSGQAITIIWIASAVEEQGAVTKEIAVNATDASRSTVEVTTNIESVAEAADTTKSTADMVYTSARQLEDNAKSLRQTVSGFLAEVRKRSAA